ncbi:YigZ family protein [Plastorhodobacter daqingensis]|uniref:YigZ family protein n=1 Tax=Plastorhodobacter daqingensis TaxID=1387281 RepID=A0ABW2UGI8_9RHOB
MRQFDNIISDRGSRYAMSGGPVTGRSGVQAFLKALLRDKRFARATHNTWAVLLEADGQITPLKGDDGEAGAGAVILRMLERDSVTNHLIVVTRWYGGVRLGGDRFRHVQEAVRHYLGHIG